jgi:hypothetical protein
LILQVQNEDIETREDLSLKSCTVSCQPGRWNSATKDELLLRRSIRRRTGMGRKKLQEKTLEIEPATFDTKVFIIAKQHRFTATCDIELV